jgi:hypothetical protein
MGNGVSRRDVLGRLVALPAAGLAVGSAAATPTAEPFDPARHAFGFVNWATSDPVFPEHDHLAVSEAQIRRTIKRDWRQPLDNVLDLNVADVSDAFLDALALQVYVSANQLSATNGHCYGMSYVAQQYYEEPETVPLGRRFASEFTAPTDPVDDPDTEPVGAEIDLYQTSQVFDFRAWLGRRAMFRPEWIDYEAQLQNLIEVLDYFGTAGITVFNPTEGFSHQVLAYGYERVSGGVRILIYDPNIHARWYAGGDRRLTIDVDLGEEVVVHPYKPSPDIRYDEFIFNRYERTLASRKRPDPPAAIDRSPGELRNALGRVAVFTVDDPEVALSVVAPDGKPVQRDRARYMDRQRSSVHAVRYRYGAPAGRYRITVTGRAETDYTLETHAASFEGTLLDARETASIEPSEVHRYVADVPEATADGGALTLDGGDADRWLVGVGGAAVGALGVGAYKHLRRRGSGGD